MKKIFSLLIGLLFSANIAFCTDLKFVQIDSLRYSPDEENSVLQFAKIVKEVNNIKDKDFVIFTGDNISKPKKEYLESFLKITKKINAPVYIAIGTKDVNKRKGLGKVVYTKTLSKNLKTHKKIKGTTYSFDKKDVLIIVVDGAKEVIALPNGYYREEVIKYTDNLLSENSDKKALIIGHFPLIPPEQKDSYNTYKADEFLTTIFKHKNAKAFISGFGINSEIDKNGVKFITTDSAPSYRIVEIIDIENAEPTIWTTLRH